MRCRGSSSKRAICLQFLRECWCEAESLLDQSAHVRAPNGPTTNARTRLRFAIVPASAVFACTNVNSPKIARFTRSFLFTRVCLHVERVFRVTVLSSIRIFLAFFFFGTDNFLLPFVVCGFKCKIIPWLWAQVSRNWLFRGPWNTATTTHEKKSFLIAIVQSGFRTRGLHR